MAEPARRVSSLDEHWAHIAVILDTLATNQNHLDEALGYVGPESEIRTQEQFRDTDARISNLVGAIRPVDSRNEIEEELTEPLSLPGELGGFA